MRLFQISGTTVALVAGLTLALVGLAAGPAIAQFDQHRVAHAAELQVEDDPAADTLTVRIGPLELPARSDHMAVAQVPERFLTIPFDGWLRAYHPRLTDADGAPVPGQLLHHVAFWNTARSDFLCPNKEEHIFGAGGELNDWMEVPGFGYRVRRGNRIRINTMFHNPTDSSYTETYLTVKVEYDRADGTSPAPRNVYPVWFDVQECESSSYDLPPGSSATAGTIEVPFTGRLLGVGGHLHDYGTGLRLENLTRDEEIARLEPETDADGRLLSMPVVTFFERGGYPLQAGDVVRVTARYDNPTGRRLTDGAMGIVVGYFLPNDEARMAELQRDVSP